MHQVKASFWRLTGAAQNQYPVLTLGLRSDDLYTSGELDTYQQLPKYGRHISTVTTRLAVLDPAFWYHSMGRSGLTKLPPCFLIYRPYLGAHVQVYRRRIYRPKLEGFD